MPPLPPLPAPKRFHAHHTPSIDSPFFHTPRRTDKPQRTEKRAHAPQLPLYSYPLLSPPLALVTGDSGLINATDEKRQRVVTRALILGVADWRTRFTESNAERQIYSIATRRHSRSRGLKRRRHVDLYSVRPALILGVAEWLTPRKESNMKRQTNLRTCIPESAPLRRRWMTVGRRDIYLPLPRPRLILLRYFPKHRSADFTSGILLSIVVQTPPCYSP